LTARIPAQVFLRSLLTLSTVASMRARGGTARKMSADCAGPSSCNFQEHGGGRRATPRRVRGVGQSVRTQWATWRCKLPWVERVRSFGDEPRPAYGLGSAPIQRRAPTPIPQAGAAECRPSIARGRSSYAKSLRPLLNLTLTRFSRELKKSCAIVENEGNNRDDLVTNNTSAV
jgi:hypothetical protein